MAPPILILIGLADMDDVVGRAYGGQMLRRFLSRLGYEPRKAREPECVRLVRQHAALLNEKATRFRTVSGRIVLLQQRIEQIETDSRTWERRAEVIRGRGDPELVADAERICGRLDGQLQESRAELATLESDEAHLRAILTDGRARFADLIGQCRELGLDVSECLLYIDLTRPDRVADTDLLADDEADFLGRVIDGSRVH